MSLGKTKEAADEIRGDILKIYSYAVNFASSSTMGLSSFISYLNSIIESDSSSSKRKQSSDSVRFMTIHGSKGLQFPICILYNAEKSFKLTPDKDCPVIYGGELGFGLRLKGESVEEKHDTCITAAIKQVYAKSQREEEMRLLYVALTRAREQLYVVGAVPEKYEEYLLKLETGGKFLDSFSVYNFSSALDFILATAKDGAKITLVSTLKKALIQKLFSVSAAGKN
jgi:ATP-dependent helicase/nuclease subunit A